MSGAQERAMPAEPERQPSKPSIEDRVRPGDVIAGKYRVEEQIGTGGMGLVVAARHVTMGKRVAIKVLRLDEESNPRDAIARFVREARATARIESEHVVRVTDVAALPDGTPYMVMELLEGHDLKRTLEERKQLPVAEAVGYVLQACEGLATAHAAGVIHRDLKPSNLFLATRPSGPSLVKVLDFGISKLLLRPGEAALTTTNSLMGSPLYMAPEQMQSSRDVDLRVDVWALGLILYELLAGEPPFTGATIPEVCLAVMGSEPRAITRRRRDIPQELQAILLKCLAKDPRDRYATMGELARALEAFAEGGAGVHADRASAAVRSGRAVMATLPDGVDPATLRPPPPDPSGPTDRSAPPVLGEREEEEPDALPAWVDRKPSKRRGARARIALIGGLLGFALLVGGFLARPPPEPHAVASPAPSSLTGPAPSAVTPPAPTATVEIASVPFDQLPVTARDAGARARTPIAAPPIHANPTPTPSHAGTPRPAPAPSATSKDDWKWGDRN